MKNSKGKLLSGEIAKKNLNIAKKNLNEGHRQRLRSRFARAGLKGLNDYELVELLLFSALPRRDTKPLARLLIKRFTSIGSMLAASEQKLREVEGVGDSVVNLFHLMNGLIKHVGEEQLQERVVLSNPCILRNYCRQLLAHEDVESLWALFLDHKTKLLRSEQLQKGTMTRTPVFPKEIVKRALQLSASGIILLHNHPSGDSTPSTNDVIITKQITEMAGFMDIVLHDHLIVTRGGINSMRALNLLSVDL